MSRFVIKTHDCEKNLARLELTDYQCYNIKDTHMNVITIDGPSAAGKGTLGAILAERLDCFYLDSGLWYRQFTAWALDAVIDLDDESAVCKLVDHNLRVLNLDCGESDMLRTPEVSAAASKVARFQSIRTLANQLQRDFVSVASKWVVIDGRDAGTVVFPDAKIKLFVTASPDVRAKRRYDQLVERGYASEIKSLEEEIVQRDMRDQNREIAPLKPAPDAYIIDTSEETADESVQRILKYLERYMSA
jgi:cytidylate kinase